MMGYKSKEDAVSPVIGILLMIVVTIIIAAVVSGFAGSLVNSQGKVPQAQFSAKLSIADGLSIKHLGGDALATQTMLITVKNSDQWGPGAEEKTVQALNKTYIEDTPIDFDADATYWEDEQGGVGIAAFKPGDTYYISPWNCTGWRLQPDEAPGGWTTTYPDYTYTGSTKKPFWALMFRNPDNIGKNFIMEFTDSSSGKLISRINVPITS